MIKLKKKEKKIKEWFWEFKVCYFSNRPSDVALCHQIIAYKLKIYSLSPKTESEYLLRNMFSQINEKKLTKSNEFLFQNADPMCKNYFVND